MRENRQHGSEGGEVVSLPYPYKVLRRPPVLLAELVHTACSIDKPLLARIEWVASRANFNMQFLANGRFGFKNIAATAMHSNGLVFWMNTRLHGSSPLKHSVGKNS